MGATMGRWDDGGGLRWLFLDLNSYFASVEQQEKPELRGKPVIVVPVRSDYTCAIAASKEAKDYGIKTGTGVLEAKRVCPDLQVIDAQPDLYVEYHRRIKDEIERHIPIAKTCSIDEVACELMGPERLEKNAVALAERVRQGILENVGKCLASGIGLAPTRLLAKTAADMKNPDGPTVIRLDQLPGPLLKLRLKDFAGIGSNMHRRLAASGVHDVQGLWDLTPTRARRIWGSIEGDKFWWALHGQDFPDAPTERSSIGHSHVLARELRAPDKARLVARRLTIKCGSRLRRMGLKAGALTLTLDTVDERSGMFERRFPHTADTFALLEAMDAMWAQAAAEIPGARLRYVGVQCHRLVETAALKPDLFGWTPESDEDPRRMKLAETLDRLNQKFGKDMVSIGPKPPIPEFVGAKIAFNRVPEDAEFRE